MGLRTSARNFLKSLLGESRYTAVRDVFKSGAASSIGEGRKSAGRLTGDVRSTREPWKEVSASTYRWVRPSEVQKAMPPLEEDPTLAPKAPETDPVEEDKRPLLCEKFLVQDQLKIDYVDKSGNATRRSIRVEEVYAYDDGVFVLRAWCVLRKGYRTFVSSRIQGCRDALSRETIFDLLSRLKKRASLDPGNVAQEILDDMTMEIDLAIYSLTNYWNSGITKRVVSGKKKNALVDWVLQQSKAKSLLGSLDADKHSEVEDLVRQSIADRKVTQSSYDTYARLMRRPIRPGGGDHYEVRRQDLIVFVEEALQGKAAKGTAVTRLNEDLLDPSFRIGRKEDPNQSTKEIQQVKKDSRKAERNYKSKRKSEVISKQYRRYERGEPARLLTIEVALRNLQKCLEDERLLFGKDEFEECVMKEVEFAFSERELKQAGEMFRKRCGAGLSTAYCSFGLRKKNRSWFTDSTGKSWLNLMTRSSSPSIIR